MLASKLIILSEKEKILFVYFFMYSSNSKLILFFSWMTIEEKLWLSQFPHCSYKSANKLLEL